MSKGNCYEVYVCRVDGDIVYIGSGRHGRHKHCDSGCSHVYELNRIHFLVDSTITVTVLHGNLSQQESLGIEKNLIETHKPKFNTRYAKPKQDYISMKETVMNEFKKSLKEHGHKNGSVSYKKFSDAVSTFITFYGFEKLKVGVIVKMTTLGKYKELSTFKIRLRMLNKDAQYLYSIFDIGNTKEGYFIKFKGVF